MNTLPLFPHENVTDKKVTKDLYYFKVNNTYFLSKSETKPKFLFVSTEGEIRLSYGTGENSGKFFPIGFLHKDKLKNWNPHVVIKLENDVFFNFETGKWPKEST